jgi:phage baseplate assembly protein W
VRRADYAYPFRIDGGSSQAAQAPGYERHVQDMLRQLLLTAPGERACLPEFGCGLRQLVFAPQSEALAATVRIQIRQAVERWLDGVVTLGDVDVVPGVADEGELLVTIHYRVVDTLTSDRLELRIR